MQAGDDGVIEIPRFKVNGALWAAGHVDASNDAKCQQHQQQKANTKLACDSQRSIWVGALGCCVQINFA